MPKNLRVLRRKIRTTESIHQITRAMSMVSGVQLRRVQSRVELSRAYFRRLTEIMSRVGAGDTTSDHPYLRRNTEEKRIGLILVAGDRGLCGGYNAGVLRLANQFVQDAQVPVSVVPIGVRAVDYVRRNGWTVLDKASMLYEVEDASQASRIARAIMKHFDTGTIDSLHIIYTRFVSTARYVPTYEQLLPIVGDLEETHQAVEYIYEPNAAEFLHDLLPLAAEARLSYYLLQSLASEHAARLVAMPPSADNAEKLGEDLVRELNRGRQQKITDEVLEVVSGAEALG